LGAVYAGVAGLIEVMLPISCPAVAWLLKKHPLARQASSMLIFLLVS
jgi:hypothetical protein